MSFSLNNNLERAAAVEAGSQHGMDVYAEEVASAVRSEAQKHRKTGRFLSSIQVTKAGMDRVVYSDDPGAVSIEYGHDTFNGKHVPGQKNFTKAVKKWN